MTNEVPFLTPFEKLPPQPDDVPWCRKCIRRIPCHWRCLRAAWFSGCARLGLAPDPNFGKQPCFELVKALMPDHVTSPQAFARVAHWMPLEDFDKWIFEPVPLWWQAHRGARKVAVLVNAETEEKAIELARALTTPEAVITSRGT